MMSNYSVSQHFEGKEANVRAIYDCLLAKLREFGEVQESPKKTSIHLDNSSGFAGVYTLKSAINLHFRTSQQIEHERIAKVEQLSARRFKHTVKLERVEDVDDTLLSWLKAAYELAE
jgi:hypothetical protein